MEVGSGSWSESILVRVGVLLGCITLLALGVLLAAIVFSEQSTGKAGAINVAGSLRMQSYQLGLRIAARGTAEDPGAETARAAIDEFERRLTSERLRAGLPAEEAAPLRVSHARISTTWTREMRPLADAAIDDADARRAFLSRVDAFVADVDRFVVQLETDAERRIVWLRAVLMTGFAAMLALVVVAIVYLRRTVFTPLNDLVRSARAVRGGSFHARARATGADELGQLGQAFNSMVEQLGRLYGSLERQVADKTADLERKRRSLSLLYETTRVLSERQADAAALQAVLDLTKPVLGVQAGSICLKRGLAGEPEPLVRDDDTALGLCDPSRCAGCLAAGTVTWREQPTALGTQPMLLVPLIDGAAVYGVMPLLLPAGSRFEPWQVELAETVGRHIGAAIAAAERHNEHQRLALHEERSAIARELHDSIAQSLSYTKIQLLRLSTLLGERPDVPAARGVLDELREGVTSAYRQLREVLTQFRLPAARAGVAATLRQDLASLRERAGVDTALEIAPRIDLNALSPNEQVHLVQIVREALANVEKHAQARRVEVAIADAPDGALVARVADDGVGIATRESPRHHFGLSIMEDRARLLGGAVQVMRRLEGGTAVELRFMPARQQPRIELVAAE